METEGKKKNIFGKVKGFFKEKKVGRIIGAALLGAANGNPFTAALVPAIAEGVKEIEGGKVHKVISWFFFALVVAGIASYTILVVKGHPEQANFIIEIILKAASIFGLS